MLSEGTLPKMPRKVLADVTRVSRLLVGYEPRLREFEDEARGLLETLDPQRLIDFWAYQGVAVRAVERARSVGVTRTLWDEVAAEVRADAAEGAALHGLVTRQVTVMLERAGIKAVVLKGPLMAERLYGDATVRSRSADIDLLVPVDQLAEASQVLLDGGWLPPEDPRFDNGLPDFHFCLGAPAGTPNVELHWRLQWYESNEHAEGLIERAQDLEGLMAPSPVDQLSILLLCFARDGFHGLRLTSDFAAWWEQFGDQWGETVRKYLTYGSLARPMSIALAAFGEVGGGPSWLKSSRGRRARWAVEIARVDGPTTARGAFGQAAIVDALVAPNGQVGRRLRTSWLRDWRFLSIQHPALARRGLIPALRLASALRTTIRALVLSTIIVKSRHCDNSAPPPRVGTVV